MNALLYRIVPFVLAMIVGEFVYYQLDKSYKLTEKLYQKFHVRKESFGVVCICVSLLIILLLGIAGVYFMPLPILAYLIICGFLAGFVVAIQHAVRQ